MMTQGLFYSHVATRGQSGLVCGCNAQLPQALQARDKAPTAYVRMPPDAVTKTQSLLSSHRNAIKGHTEPQLWELTDQQASTSAIKPIEQDIISAHHSAGHIITYREAKRQAKNRTTTHE